MPSTPTSELDAALRKAFPSVGDDVYTQAREICEGKNLSATDLFCKWEAYAISTRRGTEPPSASDLRALSETMTRKNSAPKSEPRLLHRASAPVPRISVEDFFAYADDLGDAATDDDDDMLDVAEARGRRAIARTPRDVKTTSAKTTKEEPVLEGVDKDDRVIRSAKLFAHSSGVALPGDEKNDEGFEGRPGVGRVEATLNDGRKQEYGERHIVSVKTMARYTAADGLRYMNDDLPGRIDIVRTHVRELGERVIARAQAGLVDGAELAQSPSNVFSTPSSDTVLAVGRIRVELDETEGAGVGRINEKSVVLESAEGHLLKLNLGRMRGLRKSLFLHPGMVVAVEGVNTNGRIMDVSEIHDNAIPVEETRKVKKEEDIQQSFVRVLAAAGPYTTRTNLRYEALEEVSGVIERTRPDVVLLTGPFVDEEHPLVKESLPISFDTLFEQRVLAKIDAIAQTHEDTQFVLQPALGDVHHDFVAPQPPFSTTRSLAPNVLFAPNPCALQVSSVAGTGATIVGLSSLPALQDISGDSVCWNRADRFGAIASHMLRQGSFYPTCPPSANVPLDFSLLHRIALPVEEGGVDVLIMPSKLKAFAKIADADTVVVNPGILTRGNVGGTYAELTLPLRASCARRNAAAGSSLSYAAIVRI